MPNCFGGGYRSRTDHQSFADSCLTAWLSRHKILNFMLASFQIFKVKKWSGKRGSNPRPSPWQGDALSTELFPHRQHNYNTKNLCKSQYFFNKNSGSIVTQIKNTFFSITLENIFRIRYSSIVRKNQRINR